MNIIKVSMDMGLYADVLKYARMVYEIPSVVDASVVSKLRAVSGLALLRSNQFGPAAVQFLEVGPELERTHCDMITLEDVALYGVLCLIAAFEQQDVKTKLLENHNFSSFLELMPELSKLLSDFSSSDFVSCVAFLERIKPGLRLDMHLHGHLDSLYDLIHQGICLYQVADLQNVDYGSFLSAEQEQSLNPDISNNSITMDQLVHFLLTDSPPQPGEEVEIPRNYLPSRHDKPVSASVLNRAEVQSVESFDPLANLLKLPRGFEDSMRLAHSPHYTFKTGKDLVNAVNRSTGWLSRKIAYALLLNSTMFSIDVILDEDKYDGCVALLSRSTFEALGVSWLSYSSKGKMLKDISLKDKTESLIVRKENRGNIWTRRIICLKEDGNFQLVQWRLTRGRRAQNQVRAPPHDQVVQDPLLCLRGEGIELLKSIHDTNKKILDVLKLAFVDRMASTVTSQQPTVSTPQPSMPATTGGGGLYEVHYRDLLEANYSPLAALENVCGHDLEMRTQRDTREEFLSFLSHRAEIDADVAEGKASRDDANQKEKEKEHGDRHENTDQ